ncbi:MAG: hypothetical protein AB8H03_14750 [Saprospiraceae bacterium]
MIKHTYVFLFLFIVVSVSAQNFDNYMSNEGKGLYFKSDQPKPAQLVQKKSTPLGNKYQYGKFYFSPAEDILYLAAERNVINVDNLKNKKSNKVIAEAPMVMEEMVEAESPMSSYQNGFVKSSNKVSRPAFTIPKPHNSPDEIQILRDRKGKFDQNKVKRSLNQLGLKKRERLTTAMGGFNNAYDRLFINDEDPEKFLIIWLNNNRIYANFLSNEGEWLLDNPKVVHEEVKFQKKDGTIYQRNVDGFSDKTTHLKELNSFKVGDKYYIGYSMSAWESRSLFGGNIGTVHVSILNENLDIEKTVQIPSTLIEGNDKQFASDLQAKIHLHNETIYCIIQSPNTGQDKLYVQCFDKKLNPKTQLLYLSNNSKTYGSTIPVLKLASGLLINYWQGRKNGRGLYSLLIGKNGEINDPVLVYNLPSNGVRRYASSYTLRKVANNLEYHFLFKEDKKTIYEVHQISENDLMQKINYEINKDNWKMDFRIKEVEELTQKIDAKIMSKDYSIFKKENEYLPTKTAYVTKEFEIEKLYMDKKSKQGTSIMEVYYDENALLRFIKVDKTSTSTRTRNQSEKVWIYFDDQGQQFWQKRESEKGTEYEERKIRTGRFIRNTKLLTPFDEFHSR